MLHEKEERHQHMLLLEAIGVRVVPGFGITHVVCRPAGGKARLRSVQGLIAFINDGNELYTTFGSCRTTIYVVAGSVRRSYIRTEANDSLEDNLLSLPRY
jgi:hypothetical protein